MNKHCIEEGEPLNNYKHYLKIMRITLFFLFFGILFSSAANSFSQEFIFKQKSASIREICKQIEKESDYVFVFSDNSEKMMDKKVNIDANAKNVAEILDAVLSNTGLTYEILDKQIVIYESGKTILAKVPEHKIPETMIQQPPKKQITGRVVDAEGQPIIGANIVEVGTTNGTVTDVDGYFSLSVEPDATIRISYIGYLVQNINTTGKNSFNIVLQEDTQALEEVVVIGYGTQNKKTLVGSVAVANEEDLQKIGTVTDISQALSGQIPGIVSLTASGEPGGLSTGESSTKIFLRGQSTWNNAQPLVLVDGVERTMHNLDVNEISSISVLKDASATAVYGVKGANGVILITTKRGQVGKTILNFNYTTMGQMVSKLPEKLDSFEAMMAKNEMIEREVVLNEPSWNDYVPYEIVQRYRRPQSEEYALIYPNVDWADAMFKDLGLSHRATFSLRGGSKAIQFFGSLAYLHEGDMIEDYDNGKGYDPNYNFDRFNFRSNVDAQLTSTTKLKLDISGFYSEKNLSYANMFSSTGYAEGWFWASAYRMAPNLFIPRHPDGRWGAWVEGGNDTTNPLAALYNLGIRKARTTELNFDVTLEQDLKFITEGLTAKASLFYDNNIRSEGGIWDVGNAVRPDASNVPYKQIYPNRYEGPDQDPSEYTVLLPISYEEYDWHLLPWTIREEEIGAVTRRMMYQGQLNYARRFDLHNVSAMGVFKREEYAQGSMFPNYREDWVFRATYDYDSRYLFEANGAYNGSEQFGPGYRFEFFPSLALGWVVSNEKFFDKMDWIDNLKLRYSIGKVGDDRVSGGRWLYADQYAYGGRARLNSAVNGWSPYYFYRESVVGNPNIHWETALKNNYGLEFSMMKNLFSVNFDYYTEDRTDILLPGDSRTVPPFFGAIPPAANLGHVKSKGFELELGFNKSFNKDVNVWSELAITHNENKVIFSDDAPLQYDYLKNAGYPIGQNRSMLRADFYNNWDEVYASVPTETNDLSKLPGYYNLIDFNADGIIRYNEDTPPIGYSKIPQNTANLTVGFSFKRFSAFAQLYGVNNVNRNVPANNFFAYTDVLFEHVRDYWSKVNQDATSFLPRWKTRAQNIGDYYLYDASSIRLRTAEISYSLTGMKWLENSGISDFRIFVNGNNLFYWSRLPDDREDTYSGGDATTGAYPTMRRINLGIDLSF